MLPLRLSGSGHNSFYRNLLTGITAFAVVLFLHSPLSAAAIKNLKTGQKNSLAFAEYDLQGKPGEKESAVSVIIEINGEKYDSDKLTLSGDFGKAVKVGKGKIIFWDLLKDMPTGFEGEVVGALLSSDAAPPVAQPGKSYTEPVTAMEFSQLPEGCFQRGESSAHGETDEQPAHQVCVDSFAIGKFEVTQSQWLGVMGVNPSYFKQCGKNCPVENISWADAAKFVKKLNAKTGKAFRLPTEAEWEYAATGGGRHKGAYSGANTLNSVSWNEENALGTTHPVGLKSPNAFGLHDMSGNVAEWVQDWKGDYPSTAVKNPFGPDNGRLKVFRGGSWLDDAAGLRPGYRSEYNPKLRTNSIGLRLVLPTL